MLHRLAKSVRNSGKDNDDAHSQTRKARQHKTDSRPSSRRERSISPTNSTWSSAPSAGSGSSDQSGWFSPLARPGNASSSSHLRQGLAGNSGRSTHSRNSSANGRRGGGAGSGRSAYGSGPGSAPNSDPGSIKTSSSSWLENESDENSDDHGEKSSSSSARRLVFPLTRDDVDAPVKEAQPATKEEIWEMFNNFSRNSLPSDAVIYGLTRLEAWLQFRKGTTTGSAQEEIVNLWLMMAMRYILKDSLLISPLSKRILEDNGKLSYSNSPLNSQHSGSSAQSVQRIPLRRMSASPATLAYTSAAASSSQNVRRASATNIPARSSFSGPSTTAPSAPSPLGQISVPSSSSASSQSVPATSRAVRPDSFSSIDSNSYSNDLPQEPSACILDIQSVYKDYWGWQLACDWPHAVVYGYCFKSMLKKNDSSIVPRESNATVVRERVDEVMSIASSKGGASDDFQANTSRGDSVATVAGPLSRHCAEIPSAMTSSLPSDVGSLEANLGLGRKRDEEPDSEGYSFPDIDSDMPNTFGDDDGFEYGPPNYIPLEGTSLTNMPFENDFFDIITAKSLWFALRADQWEDTMKELFRVLKPGGVIELLSGDFVVLNASPSDEYWCKRLIEGVEALGVDPVPSTLIPLELYKAGFEEVHRALIALPRYWSGAVGPMCSFLALNYSEILSTVFLDLSLAEREEMHLNVQQTAGKTASAHTLQCTYARKPL